MSVTETVPYQPERVPGPPPDPLGEALAEYEAAQEAGQPLDRQAFLERHAGLADELRPLLEAGERMAARTRPLRQALRGWPELPGYEIHSEIGRGGMGVVYRARQKGTEQWVALKMLRPDWIAGLEEQHARKAVEQFRFEAQAAARLRHPNRVRILHLGEHQGLPFYAMELIDGPDLAQQARGIGVSKQDAVRYVAEAAEAAHEAHEQGLIHRDIKPHNILLRLEADHAEALLTDFGLAKPLDTVPAESNEQGRIAGTFAYMSPEQTQNADRVTAASDVYSLGATLYDLLTGKPPFRPEASQAPVELLRRIREEPPVPPRRLRPDVSRDIDRICLRCLHKDPEARYPSALALAQELRRYLLQVRYARHLIGMGTLFIVLGPLMLLLNTAVFLLTQWFAVSGAAWLEPIIWASIFAMYPALFSVFLLAPATESGQEHALSRRELWSIWGGKMFAALSISVALRAAFGHDPVTAIRLVYVVFAALSGMAVFTLVSKMDPRLRGLALGSWLVGIVMVFRLEYAPLLYGVYCLLGVTLFGLYLRRLGGELR
jgi:serine/threonine-protein kinase